MAQQTLTLNIPDDLYNRLKQLAEQSGRTIEEEARDVLATGVPTDEGMTPELEQMLAGMALLDDEMLRRAARNELGRKAVEEIRRLRAKRERKGLSNAEKQRLADLLYQYDKGVLIRSQALALLKERGHNIDALLQPQ